MNDERLKKLKPFVIQTLRRASYRWPARSQALKSARIERGLYLCANCKNTFKNKEIKIDHINPVVDIKTGFNGFDDFIDRLLCDADGLQILCSNCHDNKTAVEREIRKKYKKKKE